MYGGIYAKRGVAAYLELTAPASVTVLHPSPEPKTQNPKPRDPETLEVFDPPMLTLNPQPSTLNPQPSTLDRRTWSLGL